jgi:hypothetical protein
LAEIIILTVTIIVSVTSRRMEGYYGEGGSRDLKGGDIALSQYIILVLSGNCWENPE